MENNKRKRIYKFKPIHRPRVLRCCS